MIFSHPDKRRLSLQSRLLLTVCVATTLAMLSVAALYALTLQPWVAWTLGLIVGLVCASAMVLVFTRHLQLSLTALDQGLNNLLDNDFSVTLAPSRYGEINRLITHYNRLTESLRHERQSIYQRELLLDTIIENTSMGVLITDQHCRIIFSNREAETLLNQGDAIKGLTLSDVFVTKNPELINAIDRQQSGIFSLYAKSPDLYHLFTSQFVLNTQRHTLILLKEMTRELNRQETATWKKVIRIISHELNNSLAPISSLAHSGKILVDKQQWQQLPDVFATLGERAEHLKNFVGSYANIAKLPLPRRAAVDWPLFYQGLNLGYPFVLEGSLPPFAGYFDAAQIQQLLLNLLKNAAESGSAPEQIRLRIRQDHQVCTIEVADRGTGMSPEVLKQALLPFYSTKTNGSGVGLPLCREIAEAHEGQLQLANRRGGGLRVKVTLPTRQGAL